MRKKKNGKVIKINSVIKIEVSDNNNKIKIQFDPIEKQNLKNFYNFLSFQERKKLVSLLSLPINTIEDGWEERNDHHQFYRQIRKINKWNIKRQESFLDHMLKNGSSNN